MKRIIYLTPFFFIFGCSQPDSICDCIAASDALNLKSYEILKKGPNVNDERAIIQLRAVKKKKCAAFELMSGPEMLERQKTCNN